MTNKLQARFVVEVEQCQADAYTLLGTAASVGADAALLKASTVLRNNSVNSTAQLWKTKVEQLFVAINISIGTEVLGNQDSSLNLATIETPISEAPFLLSTFGPIAKLPTEQAKLGAIASLLNWTDPG